MTLRSQKSSLKFFSLESNEDYDEEEEEDVDRSGPLSLSERKERKKKKTDFMKWFDTLDYNPDDERVEEAQAAMYFLKNPYEGLRKKKSLYRKKMKSKARYLNIPELNPALRKKQQEEEQAKLKEEQEKEKKKKQLTDLKLPTLPRVARIKPPKHRQFQAQDHDSSNGTDTERTASSTHPLIPSEEDMERSKPSAVFWESMDICYAVKKAGIGFVPTLVFDFKQQCIRWACFTEEARSFESVQQLAPNYARVMQGLCFFEAAPMCSIRSISEGKVVESQYCLSRTDLVSSLEAICAAFTKHVAVGHHVKFSVIVLQAIPPPEHGTILSVSQGAWLRKFRKTLGIEFLQAQILREHDPMTHERKQYILDVDCFIEKQATSDSLLETTRSTATVKKEQESAVVDPAEMRKKAMFELRQAFKWCIGDYCKSQASQEELEAAKNDEKKPIVYKLVLQQRMGVTDTNELSNMLPTNLRNRMYETVKVCSICFDKLSAIEEARAEEERLRREKAKVQRQKVHFRKVGKRCAAQAADVAKQMQRMKRELVMERKRMERMAKDQQNMKAQSGVDEFISLLDGPIQDEATTPSTEAFSSHHEKHQKQQSTSSGEVKSSNHHIEEQPSKQVDVQQEGKRNQGDDEEDAKLDTEQGEKEAVVEIETVEFAGLSCSRFFGNEMEKLALCQSIMDALRNQKRARLLAAVSENNMSVEECRLVLRSLYLEFRGMCVDQGYFPDVPLEGENAVMILEPLR